MRSTVVAESTKRQLILEVLGTHGRCHLRVSGSSMLPALWPGETVLVEKCQSAELEAGDIVLFERDGRLFLHRLVDVQTTTSGVTFTTRGDAVPQNDPPVSGECLLGVLAGLRRGDVWLSVPRKMPLPLLVLVALLRRSSLAVRLVLRLRLVPRVWPRKDSTLEMEARFA